MGMPQRPCIRCGQLIPTGSYCPEHDPREQRNRSRRRVTPGRTKQQEAFRAAVLARAGYQCQWVENGVRCAVVGAERLTAHHLRKLREMPTYDPARGMCLCQPHHREAERRLNRAIA